MSVLQQRQTRADVERVRTEKGYRGWDLCCLRPLCDALLTSLCVSRWLRPWHTEAECKAAGHEWAGMAHPDDDEGSKHALICDAVKRLAKEKGWDLSKVYLWVDYCGEHISLRVVLLVFVLSALFQCENVLEKQACVESRT